MESFVYPNWKDVGLSPYFVENLRALCIGDKIDFLIANKVYKDILRSQFKYYCNNCGKSKNSNRIYEDYSKCENCGSYKISCISDWKYPMLDECDPFSSDNSFVSPILVRMQYNYKMYFGELPPEKFLDFSTAFKKYCNDSYPHFKAQFICGEEVEEISASLAVCKAALLCPFIWDDVFDWKNRYRRDESRKTHIIPIIFHMSNCMDEENEERSFLPKQSYFEKLTIGGGR